MKAVILAGGRGTRISEESESRPKPMVEIGGRPTIWHIMKIHESAGVTDFIGLLGYKGYMIKEYFANYHLHTSDVTINLATGGVATVRSTTESWTVHAPGHGRQYDDRWATATREELHRRRHVLVHLRRRCHRSRCPQTDRTTINYRGRSLP